MSDARCIWPSKAQRDLLDYLADVVKTPAASAIGELVAQWDAAPPDATEAVRAEVLKLRAEHLQRWYEVFWHGPEMILARAVLAALNHPQHADAAR